MKKIVLAFALLILSNKFFGQNPVALGQTQLNVGFGFSSWGIPVYLGFDHGVHKDITVGMEGSFRSYKNSYNSYKYSHNIIGISVNGNYHFNHVLEIPLDWDFYAGANVGFYIWSSNDDYHGDGGSGLGAGLQVGGRYYFNEKFGINLEIGGGNAFSSGKFGVTFKL